MIPPAPGPRCSGSGAKGHTGTLEKGVMSFEWIEKDLEELYVLKTSLSVQPKLAVDLNLVTGHFVGQFKEVRDPFLCTV